jgi:hypothetical protein
LGYSRKTAPFALITTCLLGRAYHRRHTFTAPDLEYAINRLLHNAEDFEFAVWYRHLSLTKSEAVATLSQQYPERIMQFEEIEQNRHWRWPMPLLKVL